jgi:hypothetical protein
MEFIRNKSQLYKEFGDKMRSETRYILFAALVLVIIALIISQLPGSDAATHELLNKLKIATGFTLLALVFLFGFAILLYIANGRIDLSDLLSETGDSKGASMSRFQLLIFTLVIALSLFLVVVSNMAFPATIPPEILTLLGISASTYAVSKGIQMSANQANTTPQTSDNTVVVANPPPPEVVAPAPIVVAQTQPPPPSVMGASGGS